MQTYQKIRSGLVTVAILLWAGLAQAATGTLTPIPYLTIVDANGATVSGACIWTYTAGTSTPVTTWTDKAMSTPNTNPVVANGNGQAVLYLLPGTSYKYVVETACTAPAHGTTIRTQDNIDAVPASASALDVSGTAGETLTAGKLVYLSDGSGSKTQGLWYLADLQNPYSSTVPLIGMVPATIASAGVGTVRIGGQVTGLSALTVGASYYVSTTGNMQASSGAITTRRYVGQADSTTSFILEANPSVPPTALDCNGRLTLTQAVPVTTSDVLAATTIWFSAYKGVRCSVYDGTANWTPLWINDANIAVPATTATMYDVFGYNSVGGLALEVLAWTNDTTRATALATQDGVLVKTGATTRRYLGSFRTTAVSGQTEDSAANRFVWNYFHRVERLMTRAETTASWDYTTATIRQANASASNQLNFIVGVSEDVIRATVTSYVTDIGAAAHFVAVGIGLDSTTTMTTPNGSGFVAGNGASNAIASYVGFPGVGKHSLMWNEWSQAAGTTRWYGTGAPAGALAATSGMTGSIRN